MSADAELTLIFGALHLVALGFAGLLFTMLLHAPTVDAWRPPPDDEEDDGGGGNERRRKPEPPRPGGMPLPDHAEQARRRLRDHGRLADAYPPQRRPHRAPERTPSPTASARRRTGASA